MVFKEAKKTAIGNVQLGLTAGIGSAVIGQAGVPQVGPIQQGLGTIASFAGPATTISIGGGLIRQVKKLQPKKKKFKLKSSGEVY